MNTRKLAPIAYFAYNRPNHTLQTLEALTKNRLADATDLWIYIDGPKLNASTQDLINIEEVKRIAQQKQWCKNVTIISAKENKGLFRSITEGVSSIITQYGKVIAVEDDIVASPGFLEYMNDALDIYEDTPEVMHISGFSMPQFNSLNIEEPTYFYNHTSCWGWATWKRAWNLFDADAERLMKRIKQEKKSIYQLNMNGTYEFYWSLKAITKGKFQSWNCYWHTSVFLQSGLCLHPTHSLVSNIGHDGSGTNCNATDSFETDMPLANKVIVTKIPLLENKAVRDFDKTRFKHKDKFIFFLKHYLRYLIIW